MQNVVNPHLVKCPKCNSPSIVKTETTNEIESNNENITLFPFQKPRSVSIDDTNSCDKIQHSAKKFQKIQEKSTINFAMCTTDKCNFMFCIVCNCAYNSNEHVCLIERIGSHNLKENSKCNVSGSKNSKRSLRRLCSIDKV